MEHKSKEEHDVIDEDLYEEFDDETLYELVEEERQKALAKAQEAKDPKSKSKRRFPRWTFWLIAFAMFFNVFALIPQTFSIPAIDFLITSAKLSVNEDIKTYKKAVTVIETEDSKGTGFAITEDGIILTNYHVVEGEETVTVAFSDEGLFTADVVETYPSIDLAVLQADGDGFPFLDLAAETTFQPKEAVHFIGNPLKFHGIANEGTIIDYVQLSGWEEEVLMMKAPVYRGNSGSPVINHNGEVIGVVFATLDHEKHGKVGLIIPIDYFYKLHS